VALALSNLGGVLTAKGDPEHAEPILIEAIDMSHRTLGDRHLNTLSTELSLARLYKRQERWELAETRFARPVADGESVLAPRDYGEAMLEGARCLVKMGRDADAEPALTKAMEWCRRKLGDKDERAAGAAKELQDLYDRTGRPERRKGLRIEPK
jgi:Flp pilus assembly protein TadD